MTRYTRVFFSVALGVLALDQLSKAVVRSVSEPGAVTRFIPGILDLTYVRNTGAAFGLLPGRQPIFVATSVVVLVVIFAYWRKAHPREWPVVLATAAIAGGAVGNLIDRAFLGRVTDFLAFAFVDFPVFNIADIGIVGGVGVLVAWLLLTPEPATGQAAREEADDQAPGAES